LYAALQKLSTADKFALAIELWDELSSNPDAIPVTEEQLNELDSKPCVGVVFRQGHGFPSRPYFTRWA
jgi:Putative addiction module component